MNNQSEMARYRCIRCRLEFTAVLPNIAVEATGHRVTHCGTIAQYRGRV